MLLLFSGKLKRRPWRLDEFAVLQALAYHFNEEIGYAWPSIPLLAAEVGTTPRNIMRIVKRLEERGEVEVQRGVGRGHVNRYRLRLDHLFGDSGDTISTNANSDGQNTFPVQRIVTAATTNGDQYVANGDGSGPENVTNKAVNQGIELEVNEEGTAAAPLPSRQEVDEEHIEYCRLVSIAKQLASEVHSQDALRSALRDIHPAPTLERPFDNAVRIAWIGRTVTLGVSA